MPLFVKKPPQSGEQRPADRALPERTAGSRPGPRPPRQVSDRDILNGLASQGAGFRRREAGPGAERQTPNFQNIRPRPAQPAEGGGQQSGNTRVQNGSGTGMTAGALVRQQVPAGGATGNSYIRPPEPAAEEAAQSQTPGEERGFSFTPQRPPLADRIRAKLRGPCLLVLGLCVFILTLAGVFKGSMWLYSWIHTSDTFVTRHIDITGNVRLGRDFILSLAGLHEGDNAFSVSVADMERRLRETPWVEDVSVQRILPDRFVIRVQERMPGFWVRRDERLFYANEKGEPIAPVESDNFLSLPLLNVEPGCEDALPYLARVWKDLRSGALPVEPGAVATIDVSPSLGINLYFEDRELRLSLSPDDWEGNLARLAVTFGDLARRRELARVQEVRAADGRVWVVLRGAAQ